MDDCARNRQPTVRAEAVRILARDWLTHYEVLPVLQRYATDDVSAMVRNTAIAELIRLRRGESVLAHFLSQRLREDADWEVRAAIAGLAGEWALDAQYLREALVRCLQEELHPAVREAAIGGLGLRGDALDETLAILKKCLENDVHPAVRRTALRQLVLVIGNDEERLSVLEGCASDVHWVVRIEVARLLARRASGDTRTLALLQASALNDKDWDVQIAAIKGLASGYKPDALTRSTLERICNQASPLVKRAAVEELARRWGHDADVVAFLEAQLAKSRRGGSLFKPVTFTKATADR
jgi:hypothetical protein